MYFTKDVRILFASRITRLFAYGFLSVVLALYLIEAGLSAWRIGMLLALTLAGDAAISLWLTTNADRIACEREGEQHSNLPGREAGFDEV